MRILIISPGYLPVTKKKGAIEKLIEYYLDYNENIKDDITLYTVKLSDEMQEIKTYESTHFKVIDKTKLSFKIADIFYRALNRITKKNIPNAYIRRVIKDIKKNKDENKYDIIIFENGQYFIPYFKKTTGTHSKIILHLHNDYVNRDTPNHRDIMDSCNEVWTVSEFIKQRVEEVNHKKIDVNVLYNGVDFSAFNKPMTEIEQKNFRKQFNIDDEFVFLYTGRIMPEKGVKELILAFNEINQKYNNTKLIIVGGTKSMRKTDSYQEMLFKLSKNNPNILFTGFINYLSIYKYYRIANAQVVPSLCNEAFGLVLLEGLPSNLSVIASNIGGIPEVLKEKAEYVSCDNLTEDLIIKMEKVLNQPKKEIDYLSIMDKFSIENYCKNFKKLLK